MRATKLLLILFIAGTLTLGLTVSQSVFASDQGGPPGSPHHNPVDEFPPGNNSWNCLPNKEKCMNHNNKFKNIFSVPEGTILENGIRSKTAGN